MTEDGGSARSAASDPPNGTSQTRQRKKRKWDQPAESLASARVTVAGVLPTANLGIVGQLSLPGIAPPVSGVNTVAASCSTVTSLSRALSMCQQAVLVPKINQPKLQDDLIIAREIVINDAEASIRYKLTKRQTQEEILRCTGAVVITRGKYHPPNAPPDGEKPLYLHISAGSHLKETAERILAVDGAAAMIEEMLKQSPNSLAGLNISKTFNSLKPLSLSVYVGFDADPSLNIAARIRGPNDQYINHIMNETGATVVLRGHGSGNFDGQTVEEAQQPLHLFLSSSTQKSLEDAQRLAENLLDTISVEFGASRVSLQKVHGSVPPLLAGVQNTENEQSRNARLASPTFSMVPPSPVSASSLPPSTSMYPRGLVLQPLGMLNGGQYQPSASSYPWPVSSGGTSYSAYAGIYPQVTALQQVALALKQSTSTVISTDSSTASVAMTSTTPSASLGSGKEKETEKQPPQRRKFQELPVDSKGNAMDDQVLEPLRPASRTSDLGVRNILTMPGPRKLVQPSSMMPPPPPKPQLPPPPPPPKSMSVSTFRSRSPPAAKTMPSMPPPPPKFTSSTLQLRQHDDNTTPNKSKGVSVPDTLVKLMEYGEDDDDEEDNGVDNTPTKTSSDDCGTASRKPFWAA